jgi:hypothetical protein
VVTRVEPRRNRYAVTRTKSSNIPGEGPGPALQLGVDPEPHPELGKFRVPSGYKPRVRGSRGRRAQAPTFNVAATSLTQRNGNMQHGAQGAW